MQILFIFILTCCTLLGMGLLWMALLWRKIHHMKTAPISSEATQRLYSLRIYIWCVGGVCMAIATFTTGMLWGLGESILYLPFVMALPCFFMAHKIHRQRATGQKGGYLQGQDQLWYAPWEKHFEQTVYTPASSYAEKNTLEMQAFGNDMYMTQSQHITGRYKDSTFEQYDICLPDYFQGRSLIFRFSTPFSGKLFIIHRDFPCSQLLTYAGVWQKGTSLHEAFNTDYAIFTKDVSTLEHTLNPQIQSAIMHVQKVCAVPQSYYIAENTLYILMPTPNNLAEENSSQSEACVEQQISLIKNIMEQITKN